jgi:hypothetical protein
MVSCCGRMNMTMPVGPNIVKCPVCGDTMRRETDGVRLPPMPRVFWFCINRDCKDGGGNRIYSGG